MTSEHEQFCERLKRSMGDKSARGLAIETGMSPTVVVKYLNGESTPNVERLIALAKALGVTVEWLATGIESSSHDQTSVHNDDFVFVNDFSIQVSAGHGSEIQDVRPIQSLAFRREWINQMGLKPINLAVMWARGDSMEPTIMHGDVLLVDTYIYQDNKRFMHGIPNKGLPPRDGIYILRLSEHFVVKRIQLDMRGGFYIKSDNPCYEDIHIEKSRYNDLSQEDVPVVAGRVVWFGRSL